MSNRANSGSQRPSRAAEKTRGTSAWKAAAGGAARPGARTRGPGAAARACCCVAPSLAGRGQREVRNRKEAEALT